MQNLQKKIRYIVMAFSLILLLAVYCYALFCFPTGDVQTAFLTRTYGLIAASFVYASLLITPLYNAFTKLPYKAIVIKARRPLGVSAFIFALFHAFNAFFVQLQGFDGLAFLPADYLKAIIYSFAALIILGSLSLTSFDKMVVVLGSTWKKVHKLSYFAGILIILHVLLIGTNFTNQNSPYYRLGFLLVFFLLFLQARRIDLNFVKRLENYPQFGFSFLIILSLFSIGLSSAYGASNSSSGHSHDSSSNTVLIGDKTRHFNVSMLTSNLVAGQNATFAFQVYDSENGQPIENYSSFYGSDLQLVIINSNFTFFTHLGVDYVDNHFKTSVILPADDEYHLYLNFVPIGSTEQQFAFTVRLGNAVPIGKIASGTALQEKVGNYLVSLGLPSDISVDNLNGGLQEITFTVLNTKKLFLIHDSLGQLVMINQDNYNFLYVHPVTSSDLGSKVTFVPYALNSPIEPGKYRLFAEFNPDGEYIMANFIINIP